jgi:hypothetical protein
MNIGLSECKPSSLRVLKLALTPCDLSVDTKSGRVRATAGVFSVKLMHILTASRHFASVQRGGQNPRGGACKSTSFESREKDDWDTEHSRQRFWDLRPCVYLLKVSRDTLGQQDRHIMRTHGRREVMGRERVK